MKGYNEVGELVEFTMGPGIYFMCECSCYILQYVDLFDED
jgi:hypothetical protein